MVNKDSQILSWQLTRVYKLRFFTLIEVTWSTQVVSLVQLAACWWDCMLTKTTIYTPIHRLQDFVWVYHHHHHILFAVKIMWKQDCTLKMAATRGARWLIELVIHCKTNIVKLTLADKQASKH